MKKVIGLLLAIILCFAANGVAEKADNEVADEAYREAVLKYYSGDIDIEGFLLRYVYRAKAYGIEFSFSPYMMTDVDGLSMINLGGMLVIYDYKTRCVEECTFSQEGTSPSDEELMRFACAIDSIERSYIYDSEVGEELRKQGLDIDIFQILMDTLSNGEYAAKGYTYEWNEKGLRIVRNEYKYK